MTNASVVRGEHKSACVIPEDSLLKRCLSVLATLLLIVSVLPLLYCFAVALCVEQGVLAGRDFWFIRKCGGSHAAWCCQASQRALDFLCAYDLVMKDAANTRAVKLDKALPPQGALCCLGDSEFALWTSLEHDLEVAGVSAFNAGFGGSTTAQVVAHAERLCFSRAPARVLLHTSGNEYDLNGPRALRSAIDAVIRLGELARRHNTPLLVLAGPRKPSYSDQKWAYTREFVTRVASMVDNEPQLGVSGIVDLSSEVFDPYHVDGNHLQPSGRPVFAEALKKALGRTLANA
mmetsp:Transcript_60231/g.178904  ORF Transcript_60231/g.178904 Transcript_60231/m.178904 type:complete len:290 (+) Transcript_60231:1-870(+)